MRVGDFLNATNYDRRLVSKTRGGTVLGQTGAYRWERRLHAKARYRMAGRSPEANDLRHRLAAWRRGDPVAAPQIKTTKETFKAWMSLAGRRAAGKIAQMANLKAIGDAARKLADG